MSSQSANAILAKARAMYGKCLKESDYQGLLNCKNVTEIAVYLKQRTAYSSAISTLNENEIHRGQLETKLRQELYFDLFALSRYAHEDTLAFSDFVISKMEIEQIIKCLMLVNIGKAEEYVYTMPLSLDRFAGISLENAVFTYYPPAVRLDELSKDNMPLVLEDITRENLEKLTNLQALILSNTSI